MSTVSDIRLETRRHAEAMASLLGALKEHVLTLPDNLRISRLGTRGFVVSSKDMSRSWSPEHHDFKTQYALVVGELERAEDPAKRLVEIVEAETIRVRDAWSGRTVTLHPDVVGHLRRITEET